MYICVQCLQIQIFINKLLKAERHLICLAEIRHFRLNSGPAQKNKFLALKMPNASCDVLTLVEGKILNTWLETSADVVGFTYGVR